MTHQHSYMTIEDMVGYPFDRCATCGHESRLGCPCPECDVEERAEADMDEVDRRYEAMRQAWEREALR